MKINLNTRKTIPLWLTMCLVIFSVSVSFVAATSSLSFIKPWTQNLAFTSTQLQVASAVFEDYNVTSNTYATCTVTVHNYYSSGSATPTVQVILYNTGLTVVANGSITSSALTHGSSASILVNLTWVSGKSLNDVVSGAIVVTES